MDPRQITHLAKLLRDNGDKVLNSEYKLTLTGSLLRALNDSFSLIVDSSEVCTPQTFQVLKPNNSKSDVFRELQFIYDFVQKTQILCLTTVPNDDPFDGVIDITKFRNLRRLEIQRIPIEQVVGIQRLRAHLQEIICSKSISSVKDIITHCGGDKANGFLWNELKMADFSYNGLKTIDCSLEFASNLQQLNLSHNQIVSVDAIKWLPNLKKLNLSYNSLTHIPQCIASRRLQTLILTNNFIEDLSGLPRLEALSELNLSDNCILDHAALQPLSSLIALQFLHLHGNPISCHPNHREATVRYLHKNTASVKFILDFQPLSKHEKSLTGQYQSYNSILSSRLAKNSPMKQSSGRSTPVSRQTRNNTPASSIGSVRSFAMGSLNSTDLTPDVMNASQSSVTTQKKIKVRPAIISDADGFEDVEIVKEKKAKKKKKKAEVKNIDEMGNREHLETKKQIEELRQEYGDSWLHSKGASKVQNVMGIQPPLSTSSDLGEFKSAEQKAEQSLEEFLNLDSTQKIDRERTSTPIDKKSGLHSPQFQSPQSVSTVYRSLNDSENQSEEHRTENTLAENTLNSTDEDHLSKLYGKSNNDPEPQSDTEDNETIYLVTSEPSNVELFLIVSDQSIREKDALSIKTITKWNMTMLESCERIKTDVLRLRFDTIKRDKRERTYQLEKGLGQKLEQFLRNILSKRPLSEMNQTIFRCANCGSQFSRENHLRNIDAKCPECNSTYVVEIKEPALPQQEQPLEKCESHSSIVPRKDAWKTSDNALRLRYSSDNNRLKTKSSASSFHESTSISKISQSQSSFDSNQSLIGSTTNCDQSNDLDMYIASRYNAPVESDVEILSNPSISSIEVLENFSRYSSRKQSEDRRYMMQTQLYVQQQQQLFQKCADDTSECRSSDIGLISSSNSDIEELLDEPVDDTPTAAPDELEHTPVEGNTHVALRNHNHKKTVLTGMNLTESSSSGSVTDSVCTAYEHPPSEVKTTDSLTERINITSTATTLDNKIIEDNSPKVIEEKATNKADEIITLSTMLGGLFNSTNMLLSRSVKSSSSKEEAPCDEFRFSYTHFDNVDHRLKLFLYQNIFEDDNEHLKWLVKGRMINDSSNEADTTLQSAIFVMSTTKWYVLNIVDREHDDVGKWIKRQFFGTIDRVEMVRVLPWKIGVTFTIKFLGNIHFLLQDIIRTDSLLLFFANNPLPRYCTLEYQISERLSQKLLQITNNVQLKMLAVLSKCQVISDQLNETYEYAAFIVTDSNLYLTNGKYGWLMDKFDLDIEVIQSQAITNLVEVEDKTEESMTMNFLDEIQDRNESWKCTFETDASLHSTFTAIAQSWERVFQVPLGN